MKKVDKKINNKNRKHIGLKVIVTSLAVLGSAGTIAFGTLWCHSRKSPTYEQDDVVLNKKNLILGINETETLFAKVGPEGASQEVIWSSSNENIVVVNQKGKVTPVAIGKATISANLKNSSKRATCHVEIVEQIEEIDVVLDQVKNWDFESMYYYCTMYPSQTVIVKPNTRYNFTIDMENFTRTSFPNDGSFFCLFTDPNGEYWDQGIVNFANDFSFNAIDEDGNSWPMAGKLSMDALYEFPSIVFENSDDYSYILNSNTIVGHITTANFTDSIDPCYLVFSSIYW